MKFTKGLFNVPNAPPGGIPHFCTNDVLLVGASLRAWADQVIAQNASGAFTSAAAVPIGNFSLHHDWVPIEGVRSTGFYVLYCIYAVWGTSVVLFSLYVLALGQQQKLKWYERGLVVLVFEGLFASSLRAVRGLVAPVTFSPRFAENPDLVFGRILTLAPNLPSALSTLLISMEFFRTVLAGNFFSKRGAIRYRICILLVISIMLAVGLWRIAVMATLIIQQTEDLWASQQNGVPFTTCDVQRAADENVARTREVVWTVNGVLIVACTLFFTAGAYCTYEVMKAAQAGSVALQRSGADLLVYIAVQFFFSPPVIVNMGYNADADRLQWKDHANRTWVWDALAQACELVVATAQILQIHKQVKRAINNRDEASVVHVYARDSEMQRSSSINSNVSRARTRITSRYSPQKGSKTPVPRPWRLDFSNLFSR